MSRTRIVWNTEERDLLLKEVVFQANTSKETSLIKLVRRAQEEVLPFNRRRPIIGLHSLGAFADDCRAALLKPGSVHQTELDKSPYQSLADYQNSIINWIVKRVEHSCIPAPVELSITSGFVSGLWQSSVKDLPSPEDQSWCEYPSQVEGRLIKYICYLINEQKNSELKASIFDVDPNIVELSQHDPVFNHESVKNSETLEIDELVETIVNEHFGPKIDSLVSTIIDRVKIHIQAEVERRVRNQVQQMDAEIVQFPQISVNSVKSEKKVQQRVILLGMKQVKDHFNVKEYPKLDLVFAQELNEVRRVANSDAIIIRAVRFSSQIPKDLQNKVQRVVDVPGGASAVKHQLWAINNAEKGEQ